MEVLSVEAVRKFICMRLAEKDRAAVEEHLHAARRAGCDRRLLELERMSAAGPITGNVEDVFDPEGPAAKQTIEIAWLGDERIVEKGAIWINLGHGSVPPSLKRARQRTHDVFLVHFLRSFLSLIAEIGPSHHVGAARLLGSAEGCSLHSRAAPRAATSRFSRT